MRKRFSGKNLYRAPLLLGATLMLSACGLWQDSSEPPAQPETPPDMQVDVKLRALHRCSRISPEMVVTNVPKGTDYFDVRLLENEPQERLLGGGNWENDGTGIIPEGALTRVYTGPWPPVHLCDLRHVPQEQAAPERPGLSLRPGIGWRTFGSLPCGALP